MKRVFSILSIRKVIYLLRHFYRYLIVVFWIRWFQFSKFKFKRKFHCQLKKKKVRKFVSKSRNRNWIGEKLQTVAAIIESNQSACVFSALCRWKGAEGNIELRAVWIWLKWIQSLNVFCNIANNKRISIKWGEWMYRNENKKQTEFKWKRRINRNQAVTSH